MSNPCKFHGVEISLDSLGIKPTIPGLSPAYGLFRAGGRIHVELNDQVFQLPPSVKEEDLLGVRSHQEVNERIRRAIDGEPPTGETYYGYYLPMFLARPLEIYRAQAIGVTFQASVAFRNEEWHQGVAASSGGAANAAIKTPYDHNGDPENPCEVFGKGEDFEHYHTHGEDLIMPFDAPEVRTTEAEVKSRGGDRGGFSNEPEFTFLESPSLRQTGSRPLGFTVGNDATTNLWESRSMLNLFKTKVGDTMCGLAPLTRIFPDDTPLRQPIPVSTGEVYGQACPEIPLDTKIVIQVHRGGGQVFGEYMVWQQMRRTLADLLLHSACHTTRRSNSWLLTGTGVAPFPIVRDDVVVIGMDGVGYFVSRVAKDPEGPVTKYSRYLKS